MNTNVVGGATSAVPVDVIDYVIRGAKAKFTESVDVAINLTVGKKSGTSIRTYVVLPCAMPNSLRVAVFTDDSGIAEEAKSAGADIVGCDDILDSLLGGAAIEFDVLVSTASMMGRLSKAAKVLGPKGLMPNVKLGTLTDKVGPAVREVKAGRANLKSDDCGTVHVKIGNTNMPANGLAENLKVVLDAVVSAGVGIKGFRVKSVYLSSTMGRGHLVNHAVLMAKK